MPEWLIPIFTIILGVLTPLLTVQAMLHRSNAATLKSIKDQAEHIDQCLDELKKIVARSTDHGARITRLEDRYFVRGDSESRG